MSMYTKEHNKLEFLFTGSLGNYYRMYTQDGHPTLYSEAFHEACHSSAGAYEETLHHYVQGCEVREKYTAQTSTKILEIGLGYGLGVMATFNEIQKISLPHALEFYSLEIDDQLIKWALENSECPWFKNLQCHNNGENSKLYEGSRDNFSIKILSGNARILIKELQHEKIKFDCIYQDAFSPRQNPELWTVEWFRDLMEVSNDKAILSTYSAASSMRKAMIEAGWKLSYGTKFGHKIDSTRARIQGETDSNILKKLQRSPAPTLRD